MTDDHQSDGLISESDSPSFSSKVNSRRILFVAVPIALLLLLAAAFWAGSGDIWMSGLFDPPLVPAQVRVIYNGKPISDGFLMTDPAASGVKGAMGFIQEDGWFTLRTDTGGKYSDGAYAGDHKVAVMLFEPPTGPSPPKALVPVQYTDMNSTPLSINVGRSPEGNSFTLTLEEPQPPEGQQPRS